MNLFKIHALNRAGKSVLTLETKEIKVLLFLLCFYYFPPQTKWL